MNNGNVFTDFLFMFIPYLEMKEAETCDMDVRFMYALVYTTLPISTSSIAQESSTVNTSDNNASAHFKSPTEYFSMLNDFNRLSTVNKCYSANVDGNNFNLFNTNKSALNEQQGGYSQNKVFIFIVEMLPYRHRGSRRN